MFQNRALVVLSIDLDRNRNKKITPKRVSSKMCDFKETLKMVIFIFKFHLFNIKNNELGSIESKKKDWILRFW